MARRRVGKGIYVPLHQDVFEALYHLAKENFRHPRDQAHFLLSNFLLSESLSDLAVSDRREVIREALADYAHEAWSGWMKYLFSKSIEHAGGAVLIPADLVARWRRQMDTPYADLPENEKRSDRREADKILTVCLNHKSSRDGVRES